MRHDATTQLRSFTHTHASRQQTYVQYADSANSPKKKQTIHRPNEQTTRNRVIIFPHTHTLTRTHISTHRSIQRIGTAIPEEVQSHTVKTIWVYLYLIYIPKPREKKFQNLNYDICICWNYANYGMARNNCKKEKKRFDWNGNQQSRHSENPRWTKNLQLTNFQFIISSTVAMASTYNRQNGVVAEAPINFIFFSNPTMLHSNSSRSFPQSNLQLNI